LILGAAAWPWAAGCASSAGGEAVSRPPVVIVVRHAEKEAGQDPGLTAAGRARAEALASICEWRGVRAVYATPLRRSVETAWPAAARAGVEVDTRFGPRDERAMAAEVLSRREPALIVGHSNTVPAIVRALGGGEIEPMSEDEYDRVVFVHLGGERARVQTRRYGVGGPQSWRGEAEATSRMRLAAAASP